MIDAETKRDIEELKRQLKKFESEEERLHKELEELRSQKNEVKEKLKALSNDEQYQQDMLTMVYKQRHGGDGH